MRFREHRTKLKKLRSINFVLTKYFLVLAVLLVVLVEVIFYIIVDQTAESMARTQLTRVGREATARIEGKSDAEISGYLRSYRQEGINIYILSFEGELLLPDDHIDDSGRYNLNDLMRRLRETRKGEAILFTENNSLNYATPVSYEGDSFLIASYSLNVFKQSMRVLLFYFIVVGVGVLFITAILTYCISQRLSSGLKTLSTTAVRFSQGDFNVDFANAEYQELADLSATLNSVRDEVKKSGDFQRELLANVSHDLKTPLTMIKAYASMIREISGDNPEKREKHLQVIIDEADRLTGLVNDVLNVSKLSSNIDELNLKVFNLTEFLYGIINKFDYLQETQGYSFMVDVDPNLYTRADEEKIGQVIYNLLGNAVNYTGEDKTVYISLKNDIAADRIKLSIRDTGKGIAKDELPEIWDRYYRVKETHSRPIKGTGLGLNIVKIILQNHKFDFGVQSEFGNGSVFWVDFPSVPETIEIKNTDSDGN